MAWILNDIQSILPFDTPPTPRPFPEIGASAPSSPLNLPDGQTILAFLRHLGCPFCEKTTRNMISLATSNPTIQFRAIAHAQPDQIDQWKSDLKLDLPTNVQILADPERSLYAAYGVGQIGLMAIFGGDVMSKVGELRKEGIKNGLTIGSRYQTNGAFALNERHVIRWSHLGKNSGDMDDLDEAVRALKA